MKHRTHPKFPKYRIYADGTLINKRTGHTLRRKYALKIMNESNQRVPVITPKLIAEAFRIPNPNHYKYIRYKNGNLKDWRIENLYWASYTHKPDNKSKLTPKIKKVIKDVSQGQVVIINIDRVIIRK